MDKPTDPDRSENDFYEEEHRATLIFTLGILALAIQPCMVIGVVPWVMGGTDLAKMDQGTMDPSGRKLTKTGMMLGLIALCIFLFQMAILILYFGAIFGVQWFRRF